MTNTEIRTETLPIDVSTEKEEEPVKDEIILFSIRDERVVAVSNARYISVLLDDRDKKLLIMLMLPHIRKTLIKDGKLDPKKVADLIDWDIARGVKHSEERIKRLCIFGAIVDNPDIGWVTNPKVASRVSSRI